MRVSRRSYVGGVATAALLGGCLSDEDDDDGSADQSPTISSGSGNGDDAPPDADGDGVPDSRDDYPNDSQLSEAVGSIDRTYSIAEDEYVYHTFSFTQATTVTYDVVVRDGPSVDVIWFDRDEFDQYQAENRARYHSLVSRMDTQNAQVDTSVSSGSYVLVLDNTNWGEASPPTNFDDDVATVELEFTAAR